MLPAGTGVEVRNGFDGSWSRGFEVVAHETGGYRLMRCSDGSILPRTFGPDDVRRNRKVSSMWWV